MRMNEIQLLALAEKALHDNGIRGFLFKRTSENSKWQLRYFVLFQNLLFYFENEHSQKPSGVIFLEGSYCDKMVITTSKTITASVSATGTSTNLQHYFTITYRKEGSKTFELKAESESECNAWVHAIENASFSKMLLQKEELEQKHLHLVQIVESEKTAKWQYTQQCEELTMEIKKLRAELFSLNREWRLAPNNRSQNLQQLGGLNEESEEIRKIKKVQSFFRGWLCRRRWKQIVIEYINSPHAESMRKRNSLVFRMVEAEEEYLEQLQLMVSCFLRPFKMAASSQKPPCSHDDVNSIFLNAETVMFLHQIFLKGLTARMECWPTLVLGIGDLFDMLLPMLSIYQEYVRNHHFSLQVLAECKQREKFASMLRRLEEKPIIQGRTLETFLTYPMHQVPRYIINLHELLAHTPHNHVERKSLENARMKLEELSRQMHDEVSETENIRNNLAIERIIVGGCDILLDVNQVFIRKGCVIQVLNSDRSKTASRVARIGSFRGLVEKEIMRQCYLFSNHMLLCTRTSGGKLSLVDGIGKIPLAEATLIEDPNEQFQFTVDDTEGSISSTSSHSSDAGTGTGAGSANTNTPSFINQAITTTTTTTTSSSTSNNATTATPTHSGKDFGGLDFKIIVDCKTGPPLTVHLVAPTLQEKTAWISDISQCIDNVHFNDLFHGTLNDSSSITMPHSIRNDPRLFKDDVDIRFSRTLNSCKLPQIRYASPERLFERLTDLRFLSIDFLNTFLLTYRVFTDSITVIEALKRVHYNPDLSAMNASLHDSSGSLEEGTGNTNGNAKIDSTHLHPSQSPYHHSGIITTATSLNQAHSNTGGGVSATIIGNVNVNNVSAANEYLSTTIDYDYSRRVSNSSVLSDINDLAHRESVVSTSESTAGQQLAQVQQMFSSNAIRNNQHWRLSYRKFEEEQARERYLKRMNNRLAHGSISSTTSSNVGNNEIVANHSNNTNTSNISSHFQLPAGEPLLTPAITDPIAVPVPPPPSPEVPGYLQKSAKEASSLLADKESPNSSNDDRSPSPTQSSPSKQITAIHRSNQHLRITTNNVHQDQVSSPHSQSCDTLTNNSELSYPASPLSSATSSATLVGTDSHTCSPKPSPIQKTSPHSLPAQNSIEQNAENQDLDILSKESTELRQKIAQNTLHGQLSEGTPPPTPPIPGTPQKQQQHQHYYHQITPQPTHPASSAPPISSVGSCFVLPPKNQPPGNPKSTDSRSGSISVPPPIKSSESRSGSISHSTPSGRLSATSMNYLRVRGAGSKRGSGSSECESMASSSVTPRSSFQTDTSISTARSSFQHPESPQMSSKAGVVVISSRATSRRSSTASAASAFAAATAASSNPPEPTDPMMKQVIISRGSSRFSSAAGADLKIPNSQGAAGGSTTAAQNAQNVAANNERIAQRAKRESMISTAATMRVLNVLRHWVSKHSQDFENDQKLLQITTEFLEELIHNTNLLPAEHKAAVQLQQMIAKQTMEAKEKVDLDVLLAAPIHPSQDNIETLSALEIAEVMTYLDHNIFIRIRSEEFLGQAWMKEQKSKKAFHILLMTKHFNDISRLVASEVLRVPEIHKRVAIIEKWAAVADICRCFHNFNGVLQICAAFTNSSVYRLKRTWEKVAKTTKQTIEKLQTLVSTDGRFRNMREALHRCDPPCIPYLGMYLTDLSFIEEGTPNFTDDGLLNFSKMRMIAHVIREIRHFQQTPYKMEHNPKVTNYLLDTSRHLQDDELYQMSLTLEPRLSRFSPRVYVPNVGSAATSPSATTNQTVTNNDNNTVTS
ncbi:ras-specific guanine nucleotide-releasing factor 2-like isoform X1 [Dermatophagoides pteronyssinus]|uniref:ras-specific guanine nucleotide-releasing factor 2-like isoform X1 n=1 Tax=Dermatophagoides pteronyssinus TaxID=6956 RepID=UPI003F673375